MKNLFSKQQLSILKVANYETFLPLSYPSRDYVLLIDFVRYDLFDERGFPIRYSLPATISYAKKLCSDIQQGLVVTNIVSSKISFLLR